MQKQHLEYKANLSANGGYTLKIACPTFGGFDIRVLRATIRVAQHVQPLFFARNSLTRWQLMPLQMFDMRSKLRYQNP
jgi:hypothetical protein